jgi:outer membrane protein TolC
MLSRFFNIAIASIFALYGMQVHAELSDFQEALSQSLSNNPELERDRLAAQMAELDIVRARSSFLPRVDLSADSTRVDLQGQVASLQSLQFGNTTTGYAATASARIGLNLFNGGQDQAHLDKAKEKYEEAMLQLRLRRAKVATHLLDAYHAVNQAVIDLHVAELGLKRSNLSRIDTVSAIESGKQASIKLSEAELDQEEKSLELRKRQRNLKVTIDSLRELTGIGIEQRSFKFESDEKFNYIDALPSVGLSPQEIVTEVALNESRERSTKTDVSKAKGRFLPSVEIFASQNYAKIDTDNHATALGNMPQDKKLQGISFRWNLFDGFDSFADVKQAALRINSAMEETQSSRNEQTKARRDRLNMLEGAKADLEIEQERLNLSTKRLALSQLRVDLGRAEASSLTLGEIDHNIQITETSRRREQYAYLTAQSSLAGDN